ncbi:histidine kinase N-terminal 7TM domain-containing diguanylate cyclase, partial [Bacillus sp. SG-1]|uniref:histidine kinase N-terminal 7TM domain-containing diguanylate cyclase n=1 Tax=Bacillus sp. SG-1 TaxID=161544 RepID=UPI0001544511
VLAGVFILMTVFELLSNDTSIMIALRNLQQISLIFSPIFLIGYAMELHREDSKRTLRFLGILAIPSFVDMVLVLTDSFHGLMRDSVTVRTIWNYTEVSVQSTTLNSFLGAYPFVLALLTILLLIRNMFDVPKHYRMTHWLSALVIALPIFIITTTSLLSIEIPGVYALSYSSMAGLLILVNKRMDFNAVWPVSRQDVLDNLSEGILLIDQQGKIVEVNHAGSQMIKRLFGTGGRRKEVIHQHVQSVFPGTASLMEALSLNQDTDFQYEHAGSHFDVDVKVLGKKSNHLRLVVWRDVTDKKKIEHQLIELAKMDSLTKLANREAFLELYNHNDEAGCFLLMDIDHFKLFNDQYGHLVGDKVLKYVAQLLKAQFRDAILTRLGGEEFGVFLNVDTEEASIRASRFQTSLKEESSQVDPSIEEEVTVSIGICRAYPGEPFERVYQRADQAMYKVKHEGRDSIHVC